MMSHCCLSLCQALQPDTHTHTQAAMSESEREREGRGSTHTVTYCYIFHYVNARFTPFFSPLLQLLLLPLAVQHSPLSLSLFFSFSLFSICSFFASVLLLARHACSHQWLGICARYIKNIAPYINILAYITHTHTHALSTMHVCVSFLSFATICSFNVFYHVFKSSF